MDIQPWAYMSMIGPRHYLLFVSNVHIHIHIDVRSVTGKNCLKLSQEFSLDPSRDSASQFHEAYSWYALPEQDDWRIPLLNTLLTQRYEMSACGENLEIVSGLIESLCSL